MSLPREIQELQKQIKQCAGSCCLPIGAGTKPALSAVGQQDVRRLDLRSLSGISAYDPSEFLLTAGAGTPIGDIIAALSEHNQFLPFDPLFVDQGATIGGTVASGISGPGKLLYGGLRDFVMEVELIDGLGELVRGGGKVVKNAAGFDLPKLVVGSYGRLGVFTELTMKVLPAALATVTVIIPFDHDSQCVQTIQKLMAEPLPLFALDATADQRLLARFAGSMDCLPQVADRVSRLLPSACEIDFTDDAIWARHSQFLIDTDELLIRVALKPDGMPDLAAILEDADGARLHSFSCGGSVAWVTLENEQVASQLDPLFAQVHCSAVAVRGPCSDLLLLGDCNWLDPCCRIQNAIDPHHRFARFSTNSVQA